MSAQARCHLCGHTVGPRSTGNLSKEGGKPKKRPCDCACHERGREGENEQEPDDED